MSVIYACPVDATRLGALLFGKVRRAPSLGRSGRPSRRAQPVYQLCGSGYELIVRRRPSGVSTTSKVTPSRRSPID
jgi:hypothetical protein